MANSIQPVITQIKQSDEPDLDVIKKMIEEKMNSFLEELVKKRNLDNEEKEDMKQFINIFSESTVIFDPLDRDIFENDN